MPSAALTRVTSHQTCCVPVSPILPTRDQVVNKESHLSFTIPPQAAALPSMDLPTPSLTTPPPDPQDTLALTSQCLLLHRHRIIHPFTASWNHDEPLMMPHKTTTRSIKTSMTWALFHEYQVMVPLYEHLGLSPPSWTVHLATSRPPVVPLAPASLDLLLHTCEAATPRPAAILLEGR